MAWIESHQELGRHPKTKRLARALGVSVPAAIGHLHLLWWWSLDFAHDGVLDGYEVAEIADAAMWQGDPVPFVAALVDAGFIDGDEVDMWRLHDWDEYAGKLIDRRQKNAERMRRTRAEQSSDTDEERAAHVQGTSQTRAKLPYLTVPNHTEPGVSKDVDGDSSAPAHEGTAVPARKRAVTTSEPFLLFEAVCTELGTDVSTLPEGYKGKQCKVAERLIGQGYTADKVLRHLRYLRSQTWRNSPIDLSTVQAEIGKWELNGCPAVEAKPSKKADQSGIDKFVARFAQNGVDHDPTSTGRGDAVPGGYLERPRDR